MPTLRILVLLLLIGVNPAQRFAATLRPSSLVFYDYPGATVVIVEKSGCDLRIYRYGSKWENVAQYSCTAGQKTGDKFQEGDLRTPNGVFWTVREWTGTELIKTYGADAQIYGAGAFVLNYPNHLDQLLKKNGGGIWIHGSGKWQPVATRGCISVNNWDFARLAPQIATRVTPVIISKSFRLVTDKQLSLVQQYLFNFLEQWRTAWESNQTEAYLKLYSEDFRNTRWDYEGWTAHKREVNQANQDRSIQISNVSIFEYESIYHIRFMQHYESTGTKDLGWKELYVRRKGTQLRILSETWRKLEKGFQPLQLSPSPNFLMAFKEFGAPSM